MTVAYVGLGSNLGDREATVRHASELIGARRLSKLHETEPWGLVDQPRFVNAVAEVETPLDARGLLHELLDLANLGRLEAIDSLLFLFLNLFLLGEDLPLLVVAVLVLDKAFQFSRLGAQVFIPRRRRRIAAI